MNFKLSLNQWISLIMLGSSAGAIVFVIRDRQITQSYYDSGMQAYQQADCDRAQSEFNIFLEKSSADETDEQIVQAESVNKECDLLKSISAQQRSGQPAPVLVASSQLAERYPNSALLDPLRQKTTDLFAENKVQKLAQSASCNKLEPLIKNNLIPQPSQPQFYQACGQVFAKNGEHSQAIALYEKFLNQFSNHQLTKAVKTSYAQALYAEAQAKGAGNLPAPSQGGATGDGSTVVEIRNSSPEKMRIVFGGPTPRVEELEPCQDCETYGTSPTQCPNKGPVGRYTVDSGQYKMVVKSVGESTVIPFTGTWSLAANTLYMNCFYIVRNPLGALPPA
jgi:outer membrane protein assembly factor BamD (BamD/ComL family)